MRDIGDKVAVHGLHAVQLGDVARINSLRVESNGTSCTASTLLHRLAEPQDQRLAVVLRQQIVMKAGLAHQIGHHIAHVALAVQLKWSTAIGLSHSMRYVLVQHHHAIGHG